MKPVINSVDPKNLKPHPLNETIYRSGVDDSFVEECRGGIVEHLHITGDNTIISGHRRHQAALKLGLSEVPVIIRYDLTDPLDIREMLVRSNAQREKTVEERTREGKELEAIESERAKIRQTANLKKGEIPVRPNSDERENKAFFEEKGRSDDKAAKAVGMGRDALRKAVEVVDAIDEAEAQGDTETASELRETLNTKSVSAAHAKATKPKEEQTIRQVMAEEQTETPDPAKAVKELGKPFTGLVSKIGEVIGDFERMADKPGGDFIDSLAVQEMKTKGRNLQEVVKARKPVLCKACGGEGCKTCQKRGYVKG